MGLLVGCVAHNFFCPSLYDAHSPPIKIAIPGKLSACFRVRLKRADFSPGINTHALRQVVGADQHCVHIRHGRNSISVGGGFVFLASHDQGVVCFVHGAALVLQLRL